MADYSAKSGSSTIALQVLQSGLTVLARWAKANIPYSSAAANPSVEQAKSLLRWDNSTQDFYPLELLFSQLSLSDQTRSHESLYWPVTSLADRDPTIPFPVASPQALDSLKEAICKALERIRTQEDWNNLSLLALFLEKYTSHLSLGKGDIAYCDLVKMTAAVASAIAGDGDSGKISLIAGDLSGIQKFIYTITSDGALKSLRARSFYLELVTEEVVQQLLETLNLPRSSIIYAGGGNIYLLAPFGIGQLVQEIGNKINDWLNEDFQGKVFLSLTCQSCATQDVASHEFTKTWNKAIERVNFQKTQKFADQLDQLHEYLKPRVSNTPCKVCHRDDTEDLQRLNPLEVDSVLACPTCRNMFQLGGKLLKAEKIVRSRNETLSRNYICLDLKPDKIYYHLFEDQKNINFKEDTLFLVNNWNIANYQRPNTLPLLLGNYGKETEQEESGFMSASEFADKSEGIKRVGYLRMDVDRLGQIFAKGLGDDYSLPRLAGLSRQMSYFFKVYLNSLAEFRQRNFIEQPNEYGLKTLTNSARKNLLFIYAGGDDLFVSGSWNEVVEFAFDVYQAFRAYTGHNPDITLSGGISLEVPKFPLYQAANSSGDAEEKAKGNDRDSLGLFGEAFKWSEWLGTVSVEEIVAKTKGYLSVDDHAHPPFLGIWEFICLLRSQNYNRSFVRNLLLTAQIQEQQIEEKKQILEKHYKENPMDKDHGIEDIRYYLHLPKIAYTLARLSPAQRQHAKFKDMCKSFLSPYNAPYFRAIATWIELLSRNPSHDNTTRN